MLTVLKFLCVMCLTLWFKFIYAILLQNLWMDRVAVPVRFARDDVGS